MVERLKNNIQNLIDAIYDQHPSGGPLHIVLDDGNIDDDSINWCLNNSIENCDDIVLKVICKTCAELLLELPEWERIW